MAARLPAGERPLGRGFSAPRPRPASLPVKSQKGSKKGCNVTLRHYRVAVRVRPTTPVLVTDPYRGAWCRLPG